MFVRPDALSKGWREFSSTLDKLPSCGATYRVCQELCARRIKRLDRWWKPRRRSTTLAAWGCNSCETRAYNRAHAHFLSNSGDVIRRSHGGRISMIETPEILESTARRTAVIRLTVPRAEIRHVMGPAMQEVMAAVAAQAIAPAGPMFSYHFRMDPEVFDFEVGVPVAAPVAPAGRVQPGALPATRVARTVYHGPYEALGRAWGEFGAWIEANGHKPRPDLWECYVAGPESSPDPASWRTELNRPLDD
jgi:effector-binding domain-containing protein